MRELNKMSKIIDANERLKALNPTHSFIVQAPAGSGKTELLTQRFLLLLGQVRYPEEILAMTFTRKAAAEMRARIIQALKQAEETPCPDKPHAKQTWELAHQVLKQNEKYQWQLLACPTRLRIQTLDAFNHYLTRQLPILSQFGASPELTEQADHLYHAAIHSLLTYLEENVAWSDAIATILLHCNNNLKNITQLLKNLLARRDQWLPDIAQNNLQSNLRNHLENHLKTINEDILKNLAKHFPKQHGEELIELLQFSANCLAKQNIVSPILIAEKIKLLPSASLSDRANWLAIAELLLTKNNEWRKRFDKNTGFPADKNIAPMKYRMTDFMQKFIEHDAFKNDLIELRQAPELTYSDQQWQILSALHQILQIAVAELKITFMEHGQIDYTENALAALTALGCDIAPTDLALALDNKIQHILVDEFQDTSNAQYRLLEKLTLGWEKNDGRTLFLVGDPMQSIYLFREAEVGLFIRTREKGIGQIKCHPLTLSVNFRSEAPIVNWVNQHFPLIFPQKDDISSAAVTYSKSYSAKDNNIFSDVQLIPETKQGQKIIELIQMRRENNPNETIAILVRSRSHLKDIMPKIRQANIPYRAIDIDPLSERPVIQDLLTLTRALTNLTDSIAWFALLRAPWCGLSLSDLLKIAPQNKSVVIWQQLQLSKLIETFSPDGQKQIHRILPILSAALSSRARGTLANKVEHTWRLLGGPATLHSLAEMSDAKTYLQLLTQFSTPNHTVYVEQLEQAVHRLFAAPHPDADDRLQIMTIHTSKGLEFDTVILPHLEKSSARNDRALLTWMERTNHENNSAFIMAAMPAQTNTPDTTYEYIRRQNELREKHEKTRLLYVAITRAKQNLFLLFNPPEKDQPPPGSLLSQLWKAIQHNPIFFIEKNKENNIEENIPLPATPLLRKLSNDWKNPLIEIHADEKIKKHQTFSGFLLPDETARHIGTIIHRLIQQLCQQGHHWWENQSDTLKIKWLTQISTQFGLSQMKIKEITQTILSAIQSLLRDPRGQWIITSHQAAKCEYAITTLIDHQPKQLIIDRTFIDEKGTRWIIDFKTSLPTQFDPNAIEHFIQQEKQKYQTQLLQYANAIQTLEKNPIKLGLYFPLIPAWCQWEKA